MKAVKRSGARVFETRLEKRSWLSDQVFEIQLTKPEGFMFTPGQRINLFHEDLGREFSMISAPDEPLITLCVQYDDEGIFSQLLGNVRTGTRLNFTGPSGYFTYQSSDRPAVFVATGTGIAPFVSMGRAGVGEFLLLHGVRMPGDLYHASQFRSIAKLYVPCISEIMDKFTACEDCFFGRVTDYILRRLPPRAYDFYLSGKDSMIRDVTRLVDDSFPGSRIYMDRMY